MSHRVRSADLRLALGARATRRGPGPERPTGDQRNLVDPPARPAGSLRVVLAASALIVAVAAAWSVVLPLGEGPDEPAHLGLVLHLAEGSGYPDHDGLHRTVALERLCTTFVASVRVCPRPGEAVTATAVRVRGAAEAPARSSRPGWDDDGGARATAELNQMPQHPPLYYASMAAVLRGARAVSGGAMSLDRELALLRLVNVVLVAPIPVLAWATARRLGGDHRLRLGVVLSTAALPMLTATAGVVNNDNLLTLLGATAAPLLAALALGDRSRRTVLAVGVVIGLALLTKAFAVVLLPTLALACWVGAREDGDGGAIGPRVRRTIPPLGGSLALATAVSGWWYVRTWARTGSPTPSADADRYTEALRPPGFTADAVRFADEFTGRFTERFWGSFGWYSARLPGSVTVVLTAAAMVLVAVGLVAARRRAVVVVLMVPAALLLALTASRAWSLHARSGQYPFIQGRYLLAGIIGLAVAAATGWLRLVPGRWAIPALATVAVTLQLGALLRGITTYWADGLPGRVRALDAWSGLPGGLPTSLVLGAFVAAAGLLASVAFGTGSAGSGSAGDPSPDTAPVPSASR